MSTSQQRPLPLVTPENRFFWTAGTRGVLQILRCSACEALIHPPVAACRYCRSHDVLPTDVSGYATLAGFTINHRFGIPGLPAPYIVAEVALEEDPRVRLTTNVIGTDGGDLRLGQRMQVSFEHVDDVWLPLFRPAADSEELSELPGDQTEPEDFARRVRPMLTSEKFETRLR